MNVPGVHIFEKSVKKYAQSKHWFTYNYKLRMFI